MADTTKEIQAKEQELLAVQAAARQAQIRRDEIETELEKINLASREANDERHKNKEEERLIQAITALKRHFPGVHGRLVDLCRPTGRKYHVAVTVAAGKDMDAVVVDTKQTAFECIQYLREQRVGSATFLPLDSLQVPTLESKERLAALIASDSRFRMAVDVITSDDAYLPAVQYAVANTVVCDTLDSARELCFGQHRTRVNPNAAQGRIKAVTLNGTVISKAGTMTGGMSNEDSSKASRWGDAELNSMRERKAQLELERSELDSGAARASGMQRGSTGSQAAAIADLQNSLGNLRNRIQYAKSDLAYNLKQLKEKEALLASTRKQAVTLEKKAALSEKSFEKANKAVKKAIEDVKAAEDVVFGPFLESTGLQDIRGYEEGIGKSRDQYNESKRAIMEHLVHLEQQLAYEEGRDFQQPISRLESRIAERQQTMEEAEKTRKNLEEEVSACLEKLQKADEACKEAAQREMDLEKELDQVQKDYSEVQRARLNFSKKVSSIDADLERIRGKLHETLQKARVEEVELPLLDRPSSSQSSRRTSSSGDDANDEETQDTMGPTQFSQADNPVVVRDEQDAAKLDYSALRSSLKQKTSDREEKRLRKEFDEKVMKIQTELEKIVPNLKVRGMSVNQRRILLTISHSKIGSGEGAF